MASNAVARPDRGGPSPAVPAPNGQAPHRGGRGAGRAAGGPAGCCRSRAQRSPAHFDPYLDGLFTYCLSVMCEHSAAVAALAEALALAERQRERGRRPKDRALHRPWLYALARWVCLRRLDAQGEARARRAPAPRRPGVDRTEQQSAELAALAWPEAATLTPEQRDALELAVRHQLPTEEVAAVVGLGPQEAQVRLSSAACEVERTRAALTVARTADCPTASRLGRDPLLLRDVDLRRNLVRHVDDCPDCRRLAERVTAEEPWPGTAPTGGEVLTVLSAPRAEVRAALRCLERSRYHHLPKFDRRGFPLPTRDRQVRRARLRRRAISALVIVTALALPASAVWLSHGGVPSLTTKRSTVVSAGRGKPTEDAGQPAGPGPTMPPDQRAAGPTHGADAQQDRRVDAPQGPRVSRLDGGSTPLRGGELHLAATFDDGSAVLRLTARGDAPVRWQARSRDAWLRLGRSSGTLRPGDSTTVTATVDQRRQPTGPWLGHIVVDPGGYVVTVPGHGLSGVFRTTEGTGGERTPSERQPQPPTGEDGGAPPSPGTPSRSEPH